MATRRLQVFFGEDLEEALESLKSAPGAFGNILVAALKQIRLVDLAFIALMSVGWGWLIGGYLIQGDHSFGLALLAVLPSVVWLLAGLTGATMFVTGGIGPRALAYWESYVLILLFSGFGVISLRLALNPGDYRVYRGGQASIP